MTQHTKRVLLFANGDLPSPEKILAQISDEDFLVAVDGGLRHMIALNLTPDLIIGDLDSADPGDVQRYQAQGVEVRKYPIDKDDTDLELAIQAARELGPKSIRIIAALGNRLDQTLGNIFLLTQPQLADDDIRLIDGVQEVFLIHKAAAIHGLEGQRVSLLPLLGPVEGIQTEGLKYPLENEMLYPDRTRGISNQMTADSATVTITKGFLLCIHETTEPTERSD